MKRARSSFSGGSSAVHRLVEPWPPPCARLATELAAASQRNRLRGVCAAFAQLDQRASPASSAARSAAKLSRQRRRARRPARCICGAAARSANSRSSTRSSSRGSKRAVAQRLHPASAPAASSASSAASSALTRGLEQRGACAARRSSRRSTAEQRGDRRGVAGHRLDWRRADSVATFSACIMRGAAGGELALPRPARARAWSAPSMRMAQEVGLLARASRCALRSLGERRARLASRGDGLRARRPPARRRPPNASSSARCVAGSTSARSSCWPWISTSARADGAQRLHADRLVVDEGAGAPVGHLHAAQDQVAIDVDVLRRARRRRAGWSSGQVEDGGHLALRLAVRARARRRRARRAPARRRRAGWICPRRFRR